MRKKRSLGRCLGDILEEIGSTYESSLDKLLSNQEVAEVDLREIEIDKIEPNPYQPRKRFDEDKLLELSASIKRYGLLQPIVVIYYKSRYILVAGERRLRASKMANLKKIKAIVAPFKLDEIKLREVALIENIQREDLNPIELATSYRELIDIHKITHQELSEILNKSRSQITNTLRLLNLDKSVQQRVINGELSQGHAKILVKLPKSEQIKMSEDVIKRGLSVRKLESILRELRNRDSKKGSKSGQSEDFTIPEEVLEDIKKMLPFEIKVKKRSVEILLHNKDDLSKFIDLIKKT